MKATDKIKLEKRIRTIKELTDDEQAALLGLLRENKTYGLVWEDKPEEVEERLRTELPVLKEVPSRAILSETPDAPNHILIEGDNLEALTTLAYTHEGKIDVIYIDPPYNTGNKDFVYNDSYVDSEDSYRHSKWLSFMAKRLRIAKKLLSDRGVIFISIDDNEVHNLKLLMDDKDRGLFGELNFVTSFIWQSTPGSNTGTDIITTTEYILVYSKNRRDCVFDGMLVDESSFPYADEYENERGKYALDKMDRRRVGGHYSSALDFGLEMPDGSLRFPGGGSIQSTEDWNYLWSRAKIQWGLENGYIVFKKTKDGWNVYNKRYSRVDNSGNIIDRTIPFRNLITTDICNTAQGTAEITSILGNRLFDFPKPSKLVKQLLLTKVRTNKTATILDFFAGSGTTLHAVMQLNAEDGGHRQCILCTNNENGICENVTYERNKRVINGYTKPNGEAVEGLHDNNLRYYRTAFVSRRRTPQNMRRLMLLASDMLCIKENIYTEVNEFAGLPTLENGFRYFDDGKKQHSVRRTDARQMLIIYNEEAIYTIVDALEDMDVEKPIITYVFSPANDPWNTEFESIADKVKLTALPAAIYNAYKRVLPKPKDPIIKEEEMTESKAEEDAFGALFDNANEKGGEA
ncbi:MAG: site-specific DNA-methyltransferase [Pseudoflavonifractor sp.]|nr:site-specific DNA-methyltransferase [Pseudoflavonifractor sp.]